MAELKKKQAPTGHGSNSSSSWIMLFKCFLKFPLKSRSWVFFMLSFKPKKPNIRKESIKNKLAEESLAVIQNWLVLVYFQYIDK